MKKICLFVFSAFAAVMLSLMVGLSSAKAGDLKLTPSSTEDYQSAVTVEVECTGFANVVTVSYVTGTYSLAELNNNSSISRIPVTEGYVTFTYNDNYTFIAKAGSEVAIAHLSITNIDKEPDQVTLTQRSINSTKGKILIDIKYENQKSPVAVMKYMEGHRSVENFVDYGTELTSEETGNYTYLSFNRNGEFTLYIEDTCGNKSVTYFEIENSIVNKGDKQVAISGAKHIVYDVKKVGEQYYIEMPKASEDIVYEEGDVVVFTVYDETTGEFNVISSGDYYIYLDDDKISDLKKDCIRVIIDDSVVEENGLEIGDNIVAHYMTRQEAKQIGIKISYFNKTFIIGAVVVIAVVLVLFILHKIRIKKATMYEE